jgi:hypothetical protein
MENFFRGFFKKAEDVAETQMAAASTSIKNAFGMKPAAPPSTPAPSLAQTITSGVSNLMRRAGG